MRGKNQTTGQLRASLWTGELVVQNGKQSGARRPLHVPITFVGQAARCEIRLNVDGVDPLHCMLLHGPEGLQIRDLESSTGTFVNGERITTAQLQDGDAVTVGPFQFQLHLPPANLAWVQPEDAQAESVSQVQPELHDALHLQAAAVAAQQSSLDEEESRLLTRRSALERQEEQLATHLEEKRRKLVLLNERAQAERQALQQDRIAYQEQLARITGDLTQSQREVLEKQEKLKAARHRLAELVRRLRIRMHGQWQSERGKIAAREHALAERLADLEREKERLREREQDIVNQQLSITSAHEQSRQQLRDAWQKFRNAQNEWNDKRAQQLANLRAKARDLAQTERQLTGQRHSLEQEKQAEDQRRRLQQEESSGLEARIHNHRRKIFEQRLEISRLDSLILQKQMTLADEGSDGDADKNETDRQEPGSKKNKKKARRKGQPNPVVVEATSTNPGLEAEFHRRMNALDALAADLADHRLQLVEQWGRVAQMQLRWEKEKEVVTGELEQYASRLEQQEHTLKLRERAYDEADNEIRSRHRELIHLRQHLVAWRARLKARENTLEGERGRLLTEVRHREELVATHLTALVDVRSRWARRRRQEVEWLRCERQECEKLRQECASRTLELSQRTTALEAEKRELAEKALALEELRQEYFTRIDHPAGERRLERLRRRWLSQHTALSRATQQEREQLQWEINAVEARFADLQRKLEQVAEAEAALAEKQTNFENLQALETARQTRLEQEIRSAEDQRLVMEQNLVKMKEEVERIARQLLEEPDLPPASDNTLDRAA